MRDNALDAIDQIEIVGRVALAAVLGGAVGLERALRGHPAGVRTMALVTAGAALFSDISRLSGGDDRIAASIVTGIGFLGAGAIVREGFTVEGITTAATIWATAAVGMAIGHELYLTGLLGAVLILLILAARPFVRRADELIKRQTGGGGGETGHREEREDERQA
ncbi:MAG: MgtC/SapB family protein [Dehalococcoidia bacterium]|nr:MgtC/SapB family protein [Dehalococcoidia bacterium]